MNVHDFALITFTILAQMAVGSFVVLGVVHFFINRKSGAEEADRMSDRALLAIGPVLVLGMIASLLHLGDPFRAYAAITNWDSSWLSREILLGVTFATLGAVFALLQWRKIGSTAVRNILAIVTAVVGLVLVYAMSNVYLLPTQPAWNSWATPVSFFTTTFLLGSLAMGAAFVANYAYVQSKDPGCADEQCVLLRAVMRWIAMASVVLLGVELVILPLYLASLATGTAAAAGTAALLIGTYNWALILRIALVFIGAGIFSLFVYRSAMNPGEEKLLGTLAYTTFAIVLVAEVLGRFLFYATHIRIGI